ncbi:MAG: ABC transporter permease [Methanomicrobiales archaeon]|nr:ABC transporter permease [Methanomicrobiales archaeon]
MPSTYLLYVACFGALVVFFLWLRDARIFFRTGTAGYRRAAYRGVVYGAVVLAGILVGWYGNEYVAIGLVLLALYLQGRDEREKVWTDEPAFERFFGHVRRSNDKARK